MMVRFNTGRDPYRGRFVRFHRPPRPLQYHLRWGCRRRFAAADWLGVATEVWMLAAEEALLGDGRQRHSRHLVHPDPWLTAHEFAQPAGLDVSPARPHP